MITGGPLSSIREALQFALASLPPPELLESAEALTSRQRLSERLGRDLLPRTAGSAPLLIVAIAGPNNVGKSSLFNSLVQQHLSPARAEGGLTKQCLAATRAEVWNGELRAFLERRYEVVEVAPGKVPPIDLPGPAGRLYLVLEPRVPSGLLVMDTPDFDSIYAGNRQSAEALLVTADLVLFVVSRQTYQNAALVEFLRQAVGRGRPYLLVYNEASRVEVAREHLDKLAADVGQPPVARYLAEHQPAVEAGEAFLAVRPLDSATGLEALIGDPRHAESLKARALAASLADAGQELAALAQATAAAAIEPERLRTRLRHELQAVGVRVALKGVPADVLVEAFRDELDARSNVHRWIRMPFRGLANLLTFVGREVRKSFVGVDPPRQEQHSPAKATLLDGLRTTIEALAPEQRAWRGDEQTRLLLAEALGPGSVAKLDASLEMPELEDTHADRESLYKFCRELIGRELPGGQTEELFQALTTLVYAVPTGAAAIVTASTAGMGHDAVIWAGTLLSTPLLEKFVDLLGAEIRSDVTSKWSHQHGETLAQAMERSFFGPLLAHLDARVTTARELAASLEQARDRLRSLSEEGVRATLD